MYFSHNELLSSVYIVSSFEIVFKYINATINRQINNITGYIFKEGFSPVYSGPIDRYPIFIIENSQISIVFRAFHRRGNFDFHIGSAHIFGCHIFHKTILEKIGHIATLPVQSFQVTVDCISLPVNFP